MFPEFFTVRLQRQQAYGNWVSGKWEMGNGSTHVLSPSQGESIKFLLMPNHKFPFRAPFSIVNDLSANAKNARERQPGTERATETGTQTEKEPAPCPKIKR